MLLNSNLYHWAMLNIYIYIYIYIYKGSIYYYVLDIMFKLR